MFKVGDIIQIQHVGYCDYEDRENDEGELGGYYMGDIGIITGITAFSRNLKVTFITNEREYFTIRRYEAKVL